MMVPGKCDSCGDLMIVRKWKETEYFLCVSCAWELSHDKQVLHILKTKEPCRVYPLKAKSK